MSDMTTASGEQTAPGENEKMKLKLSRFRDTFIGAVNASDIAEFLYEAEILSDRDIRALRRQRHDPQTHCRTLLELVHMSTDPHAFVQLYLAIKSDPHLEWLVKSVDDFTDMLDLPAGVAVGTLAEGEPVHGLAILGNYVYLLRWTELPENQVEEYELVSYRLHRRLTVSKSTGRFNDMTSCPHHLCLYVGDWFNSLVYRLDVDDVGRVTQLAMADKPDSLSVNGAHNLLVTCLAAGKIKEFTPQGDLLHEVTLPDCVQYPNHAVQLSEARLIVCHGYRFTNHFHRVCMMTDDGRSVIHSHGGKQGRNTDQYDVPVRLAVDRNEFVYIVDEGNRRVALLSPTLHYLCDVVSRDLLKGTPSRLCVDWKTRRLYVAENEYKDGQMTAGRVLGFTV